MSTANGGNHEDTVRIAMWSGPRNISTAMMRSFSSRPDCTVVDEPFYAAFLALSGIDHPMRKRVLAEHETDWRKVATGLVGAEPGGRRLSYQKHMTHHMLPAIGLDWMRQCRHAFLIRHPARVLASYARKRDCVSLADIGLERQLELFEHARQMTGALPPVIDADRLLADPATMLGLLCEALAIDFTPEMLSWQPGLHATDGVWAEHWYGSVARSTGFAAPSPAASLSHPELLAIERSAIPIYQKLAIHAL